MNDNNKYVDTVMIFVPKWKKNATEFTVSVNHNEARGYQSSLPKPVMELLGNPESIKFVIKGKKVEVSAQK